MVALFKTLGFSKAAVKQAVCYKQIKDMEVLAELTDEWCNNISRISGRSELGDQRQGS